VTWGQEGSPIAGLHKALWQTWPWRSSYNTVWIAWKPEGEKRKPKLEKHERHIDSRVWGCDWNELGRDRVHWLDLRVP
jgi:hypothetical protein